MWNTFFKNCLYFNICVVQWFDIIDINMTHKSMIKTGAWEDVLGWGAVYVRVVCEVYHIWKKYVKHNNREMKTI